MVAPARSSKTALTRRPWRAVAGDPVAQRALAALPVTARQRLRHVIAGVVDAFDHVPHAMLAPCAIDAQKGSAPQIGSTVNDR
jgi:hypothetical protein